MKNDISYMLKKFSNKAVFLFTMIISLVSCTSTEEVYNDESKKYLDIEFRNTKEFSPIELNIIYAAIQRIDKYASFDGVNIILEIKSADEVNMSDKLFDYILRSINTSCLNYKKDMLSFQGFKTRATETFDAGFGYYQWTATLDHAETITFLNEAQSASSTTGFIAAMAATSLNKCIGVLAGIYTFVSSSYWSQKEDEYLKKSNQNGCKVIQTIYTGTSMGFPYTTYQLIFN